MPYRVLYLHHVGPFGGASRSMLEMIRHFPPGTVNPCVVTQRGQYSEMLQKEGIPVIATAGIAQFDHSRYSYYRGIRWIVMLRELTYIPFTILAMLKAKRRWPDVDVVHANEITLIGSIVLARWLFKKPVVVHVRSVQCNVDSRRTKWLTALISRFADRVIAIDQNVRNSLSATLDAHVIHNGFTNPNQLLVPYHESSANMAFPNGKRKFTVGMVGTISRVKGCVEFVQAAAVCKERGLDIRFVFVGTSARPSSGIQQAILRFLDLSQEIEPTIQALIRQHRLSEMVEFRPFSTDLETVYTALDVVCFPSHYDAPGRPIFEAAFFSVPSIAAITQPLDDTIINGRTGITIAPKSAAQLAAAVEYLYQHPRERGEMGNAARTLAMRNFDITSTANRVLALYRDVVPIER